MNVVPTVKGTHKAGPPHQLPMGVASRIGTCGDRRDLIGST